MINWIFRGVNLNSGGWVRLREILRYYWHLLGLRGLVFVIFSGFAVSVLELGGLALVYPFLTMITDIEFYTKTNEMLQFSLPFFATIFEGRNNTIMTVGVAILFAYIFRGWIGSRLIRYQANVAAAITLASSDQLISQALESRYQLFLEHSPVKIAGLSYSNTTHAALLFQSLMSAFNEFLLLFLILSIGVTIVSPGIFLWLGLLLLSLGFLFFRPLSRRIAEIARKNQLIELGRHRFIFAMATAIRDIKIMGLERPFIARNEALASTHAKLAAESVTIISIQRMAVEVVLVGGVVVGAIWFALIGGDINKSAPMIVTLGLVAIRSAPSISRLIGAYNGFRYSLPFLESLLEMRRELSKYSQFREIQTADFPGEYCATDLCFSYGKREVLTKCSIRISQGEVVAIVGPSGSGKSTLLDLLAGLQRPNSGCFSLAGQEFSPFLSALFPERIGYVPQTIALLDDSVAFNIALEVNPDPVRLQRALERSSLINLLSSLPHGLQTLLGEGGQGLSGGQRQRLGIARALYREPALLILDEVTSALDEATARTVMAELLAMRGQVSLLFVTHDLRLVPADRIYQLDHGRISMYTL